MNDVTKRVKEFYEELPFNYYSSNEIAISKIKSNPLLIYSDLVQLLKGNEVSSVIEFGCGAGWFSNSIAYHYNIQTTGVDMTGRAIERACEINESLGKSNLVSFKQQDIFSYQTDNKVDLIVSLGVLHHTYNAKRAFQQISQFVKPGKYIYIGLYHLYARKIFLKKFKDIVEKEGEEAALKEYRRNHSTLKDDTHAMSWFRDQVLHPHETLHTIEEIIQWFGEEGFELISTSINKFGGIDDHDFLIEKEKEYEALSYEHNCKNGRYFPGFFTALGKKI
jgi:SAM-dependent methyltransferase